MSCPTGHMRTVRHGAGNPVIPERIDVCREDGMDDESMIKTIMSRFELTHDRAREYVISSVGA